MAVSLLTYAAARGWEFVEGSTGIWVRKRVRLTDGQLFFQWYEVSDVRRIEVQRPGDWTELYRRCIDHAEELLETSMSKRGVEAA